MSNLEKIEYVLQPQPGFQEKFLNSDADITIGGGSAGAGKSFALLLAPIMILANPPKGVDTSKYTAVYFRRTSPEITAQGGIWDESKKIYGEFNAKPLTHRRKWEFASGATIAFSHMQYEGDKEKHKSAQYNHIYFDELTTFTEGQFFYMLSRNRSMSGARPRIFATTNPQRSGWVKQLIAWWLYPDDYEVPQLQGKPIPERAGRVRFFIRINDTLVWANTAQELYNQNKEFFQRVNDGISPREKMKSITFVPGKITDNKKLLEVNPGYVGNLMALSKQDKEMLLDGSWKYDDDGQGLFNSVAVDEAFTNDWISGGSRYISADIAFEGSDKYVIMIWEGLRVISIEEYDKSTPKQVLQYIRRAATRYGVPTNQIVYDGDGAGHFLSSFLKNGYRFMNGSSPIKPPAKPSDKKGPKVQDIAYEHLKAQCAYKLAEYINDYRIHIQASGQMLTSITDELNAVQKVLKLTSKGKQVMTITKKDEMKAILRRSPDRFDALMMRMVFEIDNKTPGKTLSS